MLGFLKKVLPGSGATPENAAPAAARPSSSVLSSPISEEAFPPSESSVRKAIVSVRHAQWYRAEHEGGCPKNACSSLFSFDSISAAERASLKDIQACISRKTDICPAEKEEEEEGDDVKSSKKDAASRLCELHRRQATWRNWGTTCDEYYCHGHEWPSEKDAPLLYLKFTSPRQAVILLHFGLLKESHVDRLVTDNFPVAVFVAHLMHNSGVPDNSAMELLVQLSHSTSTCLTGIWEDSKSEVSSSLSSVSKLVNDHDGDASTPKKAVPSLRGKRRISDSTKQEVQEPREEVSENNKGKNEEDTPTPLASPAKASKVTVRVASMNHDEHEASNDDNTESNPPENVPSPVGGRDPKGDHIKSKRRSSAKVTGITEKENNEDDKVPPTHQAAVSRKAKRKSVDGSVEEDIIIDAKSKPQLTAKAKSKFARDGHGGNNMERDEIAHNEPEPEATRNLKVERKVDHRVGDKPNKEVPTPVEANARPTEVNEDASPVPKLPCDAKYLAHHAMVSEADLERLEKTLAWQQVSYRGKSLDRKKAVYSKVKSGYRDYDGTLVNEVKDFPEILEKYRLICQKEEKNQELNHCVAMLFPKTSNSVSPKEEDLEHLVEHSHIYFLTFGFDCPFEFVHKLSPAKEKMKWFLMRSGDLLILGSGALGEAKLGFPGKVLPGDKGNKSRIVLVFRSVKPE